MDPNNSPPPPAPPPKRLQTSSESTDDEERKMICDLVHNRRLAAAHIKLYCDSEVIDSERMIDSVELSENYVRKSMPSWDIPPVEMVESLLPEPEDLTKEFDKASKECRDLMRLMIILQQKRKCPISKVVNEI